MELVFQLLDPTYYGKNTLKRGQCSEVNASPQAPNLLALAGNGFRIVGYIAALLYNKDTDPWS